MEQTELLILGAGSAGFGTAYRALCGGVSSVVLIDKNPGPGGTSVFAGVNCWEPGVGGNGIHFEIAKRLMASGDGFVGKTTEFCNTSRPYAVSDRSEEPYEATLRSAGVSDDDFRRFHFEPDAMSRVMRELLAEADTKHALTELYNTEFLSAKTENGRVTAVTVRTLEGEQTFFPKMVVDCSAELVLARAVGCLWSWGEESASSYGEEAAPKTGVRRVNGLTQCFRMEKDAPDGWNGREVPAEYGDVDLSDWNAYMERTNGPVSCFNVYPRGGISVNMLPTMEGEELFRLPYEAVKHICEARVYSYFLRLLRRPELAGFRITKIYPMLGVRESVRLVGRYVLTYNDLQNGFAASLGKHHTVAWADHAADVHGGGYRMIPTSGVYGIPYDCMLPQKGQADNLLVACRASSFSHLAASSARLSRTMLALGEAAGNAVAYCLRAGILPGDVPEEIIPTFLP